jgi:cell division transport system permease protein
VSSALVRILLRQAARNVRYGGLPFFFATLMCALGLFSLAVFSTVLLNFQRVADTVGESVGAVAFLDVKDALAAEEVRARVRALAGVAEARLVTPEEAMVRVGRGLGESGGALLEGAAGIQLGWVVEVAPDLKAGVDARALVGRLQALAGVDQVMHPGGEVARVKALLAVMYGAGLFLAVLIAMVTLIVVSNTVKLTLLARRDEIAIMKLVGATDSFVRAPFLLEGLVQGLLGAALALLAVVLLHATLAGVLKVALSGALGSFVLEPLPLAGALWILAGGAFLGVFGAAISLGRFLRV